MTMETTPVGMVLVEAEEFDNLYEENEQLRKRIDDLENDVLVLSQTIDAAAEEMWAESSIRVSTTDLAHLLNENEQLLESNTYLQSANTGLCESYRDSNISYHVENFHRKYDQPVRRIPTTGTEAEVRLRARLMTEEFFEVINSMFIGTSQRFAPLVKECQTKLMNFFQYGQVAVDLPALADGLGDLDYVVEGSRLTFGIPRVSIMLEIQRANMSKEGKDETGKVKKPEGWAPPDIEGVLRNHGWRPVQVAA